MKKIISILLISTSLAVAHQVPTHANANLTSNLQIEQIFNQVRQLAAHGVSHEEILNIFEQNLSQENLSAARPNASKRLLLASFICITFLGIGSGVTYYFINEKLAAKDAEITQLTADGQQQTALIQQLQTEIVNLNQRPAQQPQQRPEQQQPRVPQNIDELLQQFAGAGANQRPQDPNIARIIQELEQVGGNPLAGLNL